MTDEPAPDASDSTLRTAPPERGTGSFIAVFIAITVALLTGYHFVSGTTANGQYLSLVAKHTAILLGVIGEEATVSESSEGPRVVFLFVPSAATRLEAARIDMAQRGESATDADRARLESLEAAYARIRDTEGATAARDDERFVFRIVPECGAIEVMAIFFAGVVAFPARWRPRILGLVVGLPLLYGVNLLRLAALAVVGAVDDSGRWFEFCHVYVWQSVYIIFVVLAWVAWVEFVVRRSNADPAGQAGS